MNDEFEFIPESEISNSKEVDLSEKEKSYFSMLYSYVVHSSEDSALAGAYYMKLPEDLSDFQLMAYKEGGVGNTYYTNERIGGQAPLFSLSAEAVVYSCFTTLSAVIGQYFLASIDKNLDLINEKIDKIIDFLYGDKKAELLSEISFVQYAYRNLKSILASPEQKIATIGSLQGSRKVAMKDIEFYLHDLDVKVNDSIKLAADYASSVKRILEIRDSLKLSLQLFVLSGILEVIYSGNRNESYLDYVENDLSFYVNKCEKKILSDLSKLNASKASLPFGADKAKELKNLIEKEISGLTDGRNSDLQRVIDTSFAKMKEPQTYYISEGGKLYLR